MVGGSGSGRWEGVGGGWGGGGGRGWGGGGKRKEGGGGGMVERDSRRGEALEVADVSGVRGTARLSLPTEAHETDTNTSISDACRL